jgi:hypothetical protein
MGGSGASGVDVGAFPVRGGMGGSAAEHDAVQHGRHLFFPAGGIGGVLRIPTPQFQRLNIDIDKVMSAMQR